MYLCSKFGKIACQPMPIFEKVGCVTFVKSIPILKALINLRYGNISNRIHLWSFDSYQTIWAHFSSFCCKYGRSGGSAVILSSSSCDITGSFPLTMWPPSRSSILPASTELVSSADRDYSKKLHCRCYKRTSHPQMQNCSKNMEAICADASVSMPPRFTTALRAIRDSEHLAAPALIGENIYASVMHAFWTSFVAGTVNHSANEFKWNRALAARKRQRQHFQSWIDIALSLSSTPQVHLLNISAF